MIDELQAKIADWPEAAQRVQQWSAQGQRVVFTNGCFDLLHYGHLHYLAQARELGDKLVVGLNSEASVRRLKGPARPINDEPTRQWQLAALFFVDLVVGFEQDTPLALIEALQPDILVKGGDYEPSQIVGAQQVIASGGTVRVLPFVPGYSTTRIEAKIRGDR